MPMWKSTWDPGPSLGTARVRHHLRVGWVFVRTWWLRGAQEELECCECTLLKGCEYLWLLEINLPQCFCALWMLTQAKQVVTWKHRPVYDSGIITNGHSRLRGSGEGEENSHPKKAAGA